MLNIIFPIFILVSFAFGIFTGRVEDLNNSIFDSTNQAITLSFELLGTMCLWSGIMNIASKTSLISKIIKLLCPILNFLFPDLKESSGLDIKMVGDILFTQVNGFPFRKDEAGKKLCNEISKVVVEMREDGTLEKLAVKWFGYNPMEGLDANEALAKLMEQYEQQGLLKK